MVLGLTVKCDIVGHASPRWKSSGTEAQRIANNEKLSRQRADALLKEFKSALSNKLGNFKLRFIENIGYSEDDQPPATALIGSVGVGQRDSFRESGDRANDDAKYRRCDFDVKIASSTQDQMPTRVQHVWNRSSKSTYWYVSIGVSASITAVVGFGMMRMKLRNNMGDVAEGAIVTAGGGVGAKVSFSPLSWTEEASFVTDRPVGFEDFHGSRVRFTNAGLVIGLGYARSYLTFWDMGPGAASLHVGGWSAGVQVSLDLNEGLIFLDLVPPNYTIETYDITKWDTMRSDWKSEQKTSVYFDTAQYILNSKQISEVQAFAEKVAADILST